MQFYNVQKHSEQINAYTHKLVWKTQKNETKKIHTKEIFNKKYAIIIVGSIPSWDELKPVFKEIWIKLGR